jgi:hypothetical protein
MLETSFEFTCPKCGSHEWVAKELGDRVGDRAKLEEHALGHCVNGDFSWRRRDDTLYFHVVRKEPEAEPWKFGDPVP